MIIRPFRDLGRLLLKLFCIYFGSLIYPQFTDVDYPDWFLNPINDSHIVGLSEKVSSESATIINAYLDALAINELMQNGKIKANVISSRGKLADSLGIGFGRQIELPNGVTLIRQFTTGNLFGGLFSIIYGEKRVDRRSNIAGNHKITAIGKQTLHPDRIYESWASAEIEAFKELSKIKNSKVKSIVKQNENKLGKLIYLQSESNFKKATIERRWIENNVAHVKVSDIP